MPIEYGRSSSGEFEFAPKIGEEKTFTIIKATKIDSPNGDMNFKNRKKDFGYYYELTMDNGKVFILNTWSLFFKMKDLNVQDGDRITIRHPMHGTYIVEKHNMFNKSETIDKEPVGWDS